MKYKIIKFNELLGRITILPEGFNEIDIDLPIDDDNNVPHGDVLRSYIKGFLPTHHVARTTKLDAGIKNSKLIIDMLEDDDRPIVPVMLEDNQESLQELINRSIIAILHEEGLLK